MPQNGVDVYQKNRFGGLDSQTEISAEEGKESQQQQDTSGAPGGQVQTAESAATSAGDKAV